MVRIYVKYVFLLIALLMLGCIKTRPIRYETIDRPPKPPDYPMEILGPANIDRPYKVIGVVQVNAGKLHSTEDTIEQLKAAARKMGGDMLIDLQQGPSPGGIVAPTGDMYFYGNTREIWSAKVVVWE